MRLAALAAGAGVPAEDFAGQVIEIHARAALLAVGDDNLVTLLAPELGRQPFGFTFDAPTDLSLRAVVAVGAEIAARGGVLRVTGSALAIDLRDAIPWRSSLATLQLDVGQAPVARAYRAARSALDADGRGKQMLQASGALLDLLTHATRRHDAVAAEDAMSGLVGRGEGRTPAGDDYLVGYFAALWSCSDASKNFAAVLADRLVALATQTERLSGRYLEAAAGGEVSERIAAVAAAIARGAGNHTIGAAVAAALKVGHTSGAAALEGLLQGCTVCAEVL